MHRRTFLGTLASAALVRTLLAQGAITVTELAPKLHLLSGAGGNIVIHEGPEGLLLIDSGVPEAATKVLAETGKIGSGKVSHLINTHWHYDHVGANVDLGKKGAKILAHENTKTRLSTRQTVAALQRTFDPLAPEGIPSETFRDHGTLSHGKEKLHYRHMPPAHTDGDTVIHFQDANVYHGGDLLFIGSYPFIDYSSGGSLAGMAADAERVWKEVDGKTKVVPGHGPVSTKSDVRLYADMLADCHTVMARLIKEGKTVDEIKAAKPFSKYDAKLGSGFIGPEQWIGLNYLGMKPS